MRTITLLIVHCSAVRPSRTSSAKEIDAWHRARGFTLGIGYHYVIRRDGSIELGRPEEVVGAHCKNHNRHSIGICYEGGLDEAGKPADTRTAEQKATLHALITELRRSYPKAVIVGHHDLDLQKDCPCFDATHEYADV